MKARIQRTAVALRRHLLTMVLTAGIVVVALVTIALGLHLRLGFRSQPDRAALAAIAQTELARSLPEVNQAIRSLAALGDAPMLPSTRSRLLVALGDLHRQGAALDPSFPAHKDHLDSATHYYRKARELVAPPDVAMAILDGQAHLHYQRQEWAAAETGIARMLRRELSTEERSTLEMLRCHCLVSLGRAEEAYAILGLTLRRYTAGAVHDQAKILLAEMLANELARRKAAAGLPPPPAASDDEPAPAPEPGSVAALDDHELATRADAMLRDMLGRLPDDDERRLRVLNGLLELCIVTGEVEHAYTYVRELEGVIGQREQQVRSYDLLATLEESQGNLAAAEEAMLFAIREFPEHERSHHIRRRLSRLLFQQGRLREGLAMFESILQHARGREWAEAVAYEMLPGHPHSITDRLAAEEDNGWAFDALLRLVRTLDRDAGPRDFLVRERVLFLRVALPWRAGRFAAAEAEAPAYYAATPFRTFLPDVLALDAECAAALRRGPSVRAVRAHRYLHAFPDGSHGERMLAILLRAYYEMQLYRDDLELAEAAFVRAMVQDGEETGQPAREPAIRTIRWIAQSNSRLGRTEMANPLFQRLAQRLDEIDPDLDFYQDWGNAAWDAEQWREAIRRFEVAALRTPPGRDRERLLAMAFRARFLAAQPGVHAQVRQHLDALRRRGFPAEDDVLRPLVEILLEHALRTGPDAVPGLLADVRAELPGIGWDTAWALRLLQASLAEGREQQALAELAPVYPATGQDAADRPNRLGSCLETIETLAELARRTDELKERGL